MDDNKDSVSIAKNVKKEEILTFFNSHQEKNIEITKENYDKLVEQNYPLEHLSKRRD